MVIRPRPFCPRENSGFRELSFPMAVFNKFGVLTSINSLAESIRRFFQSFDNTLVRYRPRLFLTVEKLWIFINIISNGRF